MIKEQDNEFEEILIDNVEKCIDGTYTIKREDGFSFFVGPCDIEIKSGSIARFYGKGIGFPVRGLDIDDHECFYFTPEQFEIKQKMDLYGKDAQDLLKRWDSGRSIFTIEMGGLGPGYEQAIHVLTMEIMRDEIGNQLPSKEKWPEWGDLTISRLDDKMGGFSGAQVGAAKNLAYSFLKYGPVEIIEKYKESSGENRIIQVSKSFPSL